MNPSRRSQIAINSFIITSGAGFATVLPILIGAIVDELEFTREMVGWISSVGILGMGLGGIIATLLIGKFRIVAMIRLALLGLILFDFLSIFVATPTNMMVIRFLSGVCGGFIYAGGLAIFSSLKDAIKAFGVYVIVYCLWTTVVLVGLPHLLAWYGLKAGFLMLVGISVLSLISSFLIVNLEKRANHVEMISLTSLLQNKAVLLGLLAYFMMQMGGGTVWAYVERIAKEAMIAPEITGYVLGFSSLVAFVGGVLVTRIGQSKGLRMPLIWGLIVMSVGVGLLLFSKIIGLYVLSVCIIGGAWAFVIPYFQQLQTKFDETGKVVSLGSIVNMGGRAAGPATAALLIGSSAFVNIVWVGLAAMVASLLLVIILLKRGN